MDIEYLSTEDLLDLARRLLGDPVPMRDIGLMGAAAVFLELNDASVSTAADDAVYGLVMTVASTDIGVDGIAAALRQMSVQST